MVVLHTDRNGVAPLTEETAPASPAVVPFFAGNKRAIMINEYQVEIIERLREASLDHGEVADLLSVLAECFPHLSSGDYTFHGDEGARVYLAAALNANAFACVDRLKNK